MSKLGVICYGYLHGRIKVDKLPIAMDADDVARLEVPVDEPLPVVVQVL
jgi:hypothetical protein